MYAAKQVFPTEELKGRRQTTAARIEAQFRTLLAERGYHQISVADISESCGIARSTFYRLFAEPVEVLWAIARPSFDGAMDSALKGDAAGFSKQFRALWAIPGLAEGLAHAKAASDIRSKLETLVTARLRQRVGGRTTDTCALVMVAAMLAVIGRGNGAPSEPEMGELMSLIYIAAYLTPAALQSIAREQARHAIVGRFPPAVSVEESLASDDHIVSMIDGRRYRSLTRHIARYGMTPADYRRCFGLDDDYPMVAATYSERRRALAISAGFGLRRGVTGHAAAA